MATKDCCLLSNNKQQTFDGGTSSQDSQYSNINLNQNSKHTDSKLLHSQSSFSNINGTKNNNVYKNTALDFVGDKNFDTSAKNTSNSWKKNDFLSNRSESLCPNNLQTKKKVDNKRSTTSNSNSSTLSLHITAYENSIEAQNSDKKSDDSLKTKEKQQDKLSKTWKNVKSTDTGAALKHSFEFPRQQLPSPTVPEVMQFKTSQKLLNPNESTNKNKAFSNAASVKNVCECLDDFKLCSDIIKAKFENDQTANFISKFVEQFPSNIRKHNCGFNDDIYYDIKNVIKECLPGHFKPLLKVCIKANVLKEAGKNIPKEELSDLERELDKLNDAQLLFILKQQECKNVNPDLPENVYGKAVWCSVKKAWLRDKLKRCKGFNKMNSEEILDKLMKGFEKGRHFMNMDAKVLHKFFENLPPATKVREIGQFLETYYSLPLDLDYLKAVIKDQRFESVNQKERRLKTIFCLRLFEGYLRRIRVFLSAEVMRTLEPLLQNLFKSWPPSKLLNLFDVVKTEKDLSHMIECLELLADWPASYESCPLNDLKNIPSSQWSKRIHQALVDHNFGEEVHEFTLDELVDQIFAEDNQKEIGMSKEELVEIYNQYKAEYNSISDKNLKQMETLLDQEIPTEFCKRLAYIIHVKNLYFGFEVRIVQILACILAYQKPETRIRMLQINTGEGKTNIIAIMAVLKALDKIKVDVITSSTELADDQSKKMAPFFRVFKLTTGNNSSLDPNPYSYDIVYGEITNFKFHILHDEFEKDGTKCGRKCEFALLDEADSIMIDRYSDNAYLGNEVPGMIHILPIFGAIWKQVELIDSTITKQNGKYYMIRPCAEELQNAEEIDDIKKYYFNSISHYIKRLLRIEKPTEEERYPEMKYPNFLKKYVESQIDPWIKSAISAKFIKKLNCDYTLEDGKITIVDAENTGVLQHSTQWSNGLHQFLQMPHGCQITVPRLITNFMSTSTLIQRYGTNLIPLTGTAGNDIDKKFLRETYNSDCVIFPPYRKSKHVKLRPIICKSEEEWMDQIVSSNSKKMKNGQAVLIVVKHIETADRIAARLEKLHGSKVVFKYTKNKQNNQSSIIQRTFKPGEVIVSTNIIGRGTDLLVSEEVERNGGLHVSDTFFSVNERVERQKIGRTSRSGKSGTSQAILHFPYFTEEADSIIELLQQAQRDNVKIRMAQKKKQIEINKKNNEIFEKFCEFKDKMNSEKNDEFIQQALKEKFGFWLLENGDELSTAEFEKFEKYCSANTGESLIQNPFIFVQMAINAIEENELGKANVYLTKAIDSDPEFLANAYYWRGLINVLSHNWVTNNKSAIDNAFKDFKKAREIIETQHAYYLQLISLANSDESVQLHDQIGRLKALYQIIINSIDAAIGQDVQKMIDCCENELKKPELIDEERSKLKEQKKYLEDNRQKLEKGVLHAARENGNKVKIEERSLKDALPPEERNELYENGIQMLGENGFQNVFVFNERPSINWGSVIGLGLLALGQVVAGAATTLFSVGSGLGVGMTLIRQGISDAITAVKDVIINRNFNWATWACQKAVSLAVDLVCAGFSAIKNAASGVVRGAKVAAKCTEAGVKPIAENAFKSSAKLVAAKAAKAVSREVFVHYSDVALANTVEQTITEAVTNVVYPMVSNFFKDDANIKILIECDRKNRNNKYAKKLEHKLLNLLEADKNVFLQWGRTIKTCMDKCGLIGKTLAFISDHGNHLIVLQKILKFLPIYAEEISKSKECQDDLKKEPPPHDETIVRVAPLEITLEDFCRHLSSKISSRVVSVAKGALVQTVASGVVNFGFKPLDACVYGDVRKFRKEWGGRTGTFERTDARLKYGTHALKIEENIKITLNGGPAEAVNVGILAQEIGRKIIVLDGEEKHSFDVDSEEEPIVLKYVRSDNDDKVGHYEFANGKTFESSGENNCLYDAIAAETGMDPNELRKQTANLMMDNYMAFSELQQEYQWISLSAGKVSSLDKHFMTPNPHEPTDIANANSHLIDAEIRRCPNKTVEIVSEIPQPNGEKLRKRTIYRIPHEVVNQKKAILCEELKKKFGYVPDFKMQMCGKFEGYEKTALYTKEGVKISKDSRKIYGENLAFDVVDGELGHYDYRHPNSKKTERGYFTENPVFDTIKFEALEIFPKKSPKKPVEES